MYWWTLDDCALMLLDILDALEIDQVIAMGHSWGSKLFYGLQSGHQKDFNRLVCAICLFRLQPQKLNCFLMFST